MDCENFFSTTEILETWMDRCKMNSKKVRNLLYIQSMCCCCMVNKGSVTLRADALLRLVHHKVVADALTSLRSHKAPILMLNSGSKPPNIFLTFHFLFWLRPNLAWALIAAIFKCTKNRWNPTLSKIDSHFKSLLNSLIVKPKTTTHTHISDYYDIET